MLLEAPFYYLGLASSAYLAIQFGQFLYLYLRPSSLGRYKKGAESWALITGSSDGIGLGFAKELCRKGFNVILLGHKTDELESAGTSLLRQTPTAQVRILVANAISISQIELEEVVASIRDLHITILINNIGGLPLTHDFFKPLWKYIQQEIDDTIIMNSGFIARLTKLLVPVLARNGLSLILNVSSAGHVGIPYQVKYSGTKGFVSAFSAALGIEVKCEGLPIDVMATVPGKVRSGSNIIPLSWFVPNADKYAREALRTVGCGRLVVSGYWRHALQILLLGSIPGSLRQQALADDMNYLRNNNTMHKD